MAKHQEWVYIPNYLGLEAIFNTKRGVMWQVVTFKNNKKKADWYDEKEEQLKANGVPFINMHKKYPIILFPVLFYKDIELEKLISVGNKACDWYANLWLNKNN